MAQRRIARVCSSSRSGGDSAGLAAVSVLRGTRRLQAMVHGATTAHHHSTDHPTPIPAPAHIIIIVRPQPRLCRSRRVPGSGRSPRWLDRSGRGRRACCRQPYLRRSQPSVTGCPALTAPSASPSGIREPGKCARRSTNRALRRRSRTGCDGLKLFPELRTAGWVDARAMPGTFTASLLLQTALRSQPSQPSQPATRKAQASIGPRTTTRESPIGA